MAFDNCQGVIFLVSRAGLFKKFKSFLHIVIWEIFVVKTFL